MSRSNWNHPCLFVCLFFYSYYYFILCLIASGYLASIPDLFLCELLEYFSSLVEHGTPPMEALHVNLPNLFGQAFGFHSHQVSCRLLQYGYLAVCSHHKWVYQEGQLWLSRRKVFRHTYVNVLATFKVVSAWTDIVKLNMFVFNIHFYCVLNRPIEFLYIENLLNWKVSCARNIPQ